MAMNRPALPRVIGHRGLAALAPENTLAGLRAAAGHGLSWVEFDVRLSRDGVVLLFHDDTLERTSDGAGLFNRLSAAELQALDAGSWFSPAFAGERIPTLDEALSLCLALGLGANIEVKPNPGEAEATVRAIAACLANFAAPPPLLLSSFELDALAAGQRDLPALPRGLLVQNWREEDAELLDRLGCASLNLAAAGLDESLLARLRALKCPLLVYTINDPDQARRLLALGVTGVFSDQPLAL